MSDQVFTFRVEDQGVEKSLENYSRKEEELTDKTLEGYRKKTEAVKQYKVVKEEAHTWTDEELSEFRNPRASRTFIKDPEKFAQEKKERDYRRRLEEIQTNEDPQNARIRAREEGFSLTRGILKDTGGSVERVESSIKAQEEANEKEKKSSDIQASQVREKGFRVAEDSTQKKQVEDIYREQLRQNKSNYDLGQLQLRYVREQIQALKENSQQIRESKEGKRAVQTGDVSQLSPEQAYQANYIRSGLSSAGPSTLGKEMGTLGRFGAGAAGLAIGGGIAALALSVLKGLNSMEAEVASARTGERYDLAMESKIPFSDRKSVV